jgi:hypothetical protein
MPRYFLNVRYRDGAEHLAVDEEGEDLPDADALREHVLEVAHDMLHQMPIRGVNWHECIFEVTDEAGQAVMTVPFAEAGG